MSTNVYFEQWNGVGNLLNIVDNRDGKYSDFFGQTEIIHKLCAESGADGLMEITTAPSDSGAEYEVTYYSLMGIRGTIPLCGNGSRCCVAYACTNDIVPTGKHSNFTFMAGDGIHTGSYKMVDGKHQVSISMRDINKVIKMTNDELFANCGTAHVVKIVPQGSVRSMDIETPGYQLAKEHADIPPPPLANIVNFAEEMDDDVVCRCFHPTIKKEIHACGTGSTSIAVCHAEYKAEHDGYRKKNVIWRDGPITVGYKKTGSSYSELSLESFVKCDFERNFTY